MKYLVLLILILSFNAKSQFTINEDEELILNIKETFYTLHKVDPDDVIQLFVGSCGLNSCTVDNNTPFTIRYKIKNAASCIASKGTKDWRVNLPIGNGTGDFIKRINGINSDKQFKLKCTKKETLTKESLIKFQQVELSEVIKAIGFTDDYSVMIALVGTDIKIVPFNAQSEPYSLNYTKEYNDTYRFIFTINDKPFQSYDEFYETAVNPTANCFSYGYSSGKPPKLQLSNQNDTGTCQKELSKGFYLTYAQYELKAK